MLPHQQYLGPRQPRWDAPPLTQRTQHQAVPGPV